MIKFAICSMKNNCCAIEIDDCFRPVDEFRRGKEARLRWTGGRFSGGIVAEPRLKIAWRNFQTAPEP